MKKNMVILPLLFTALSVNQYQLTFAFAKANDISGHWAEKTIIEWQSQNKISGYEDNTFRPDFPISRAEFVHLLNSIISMEQGEFSNFDDVSTNDWFYNDIAKAVSNHIISGFEDNTFRPNEMITRAQAALIISNALHLTTTTNEIMLTDDNDIPEWSKSAVYAMLNAGYLSGYEDGSFGANKSMTRAEAVSMLDRIDKSIKSSENTNKIENNNTNTNVAYIDATQDYSETKEKESAKMVWENGGGSSSYTSKNRYSKPSKDTEDYGDSKNIININKDNIYEFYGQTLKDTVILELEDTSIELINMKFIGDVEIISKMQSDTTPTLYLKGNTSIKNITVSSPAIINSENNNITTLIAKAETTIAGNTQIKNLQCYAKTNIIDNTNITDTAQISSILTADSNTKINIVELIANTEANFTSSGIINKIITSGKGTISYIHLNGNVDTKIDIANSVVLENITLSENAKADIIIQKNGELKELLSSSKCLGTTVTNYGTVGYISATNTETIIAENAIVNLAELQSIKILSQPYRLHYNRNDSLSLEGISLLLQYENNITQTINNINDFDLYHIEALPAHNTVLTTEYHNQPIKIYSNNIYVNTDFIMLDDMVAPKEDTINKQPLLELIEECKTILNQTHIKNTNDNLSQEHTDKNDFDSFQDTEDNISQELYYIDEDDFNSFKNTISISEKLLSKENITQNEIQKQYNILQTALQEFEIKRLLQKIISEPIISVSNSSPEYGTDDVTFTIENLDPDLTYYYTLDGSDPTTESKVFTESVTLTPPEKTEETTITIKVIAVQGENHSTIAEQTVTYSAAVSLVPIEEIVLYNIKPPLLNEIPNNNVLSKNDEQYNVISCNWKVKDFDDSENEENIEEKEEIEATADTTEEENLDDTKITKFEPETTYIAEIHLMSLKPNIFDLESDIKLKLSGALNEAEENISIDDYIENIEIDKEHSTVNDLYMLVTFEATPPIPTMELAQEEFNKLLPQANLFEVSIPNSIIEDENSRNEKILEAAQSVVSKYWTVEFEPSFFNKLNDTQAFALGKFTIKSEIDTSIVVNNKYDLQITINIESDSN